MQNKKYTYRFEEQKAETGPFGSMEAWSGYVVYTDQEIMFDGYETEAEAKKVVMYMNHED